MDIDVDYWIEAAMKKTGKSEDELMHDFMEYLIRDGKNPFQKMPVHHLRKAEEKFPDLIELARRKFGAIR